MRVKITAPNQSIKSFISLPASKSISNRMLIIRALCSERFKIRNLSKSNDTQVMLDGLKNISADIIDIGAAGTSMRFLTALLSTIPGDRILTGTNRMKKRPVHELVNMLRELGAKIEYIEHEGYPPLKIIGGKLQSKPIKIKGNISSQYISALLMIAPYLDNGLQITIQDKIVSKSYILMTINLMKQYGIDIEWDKNVITIKQGEYKPNEIIVEADWSSASYWYEIISLSKDSMIELTGLKPNSLQGDSIITELFKPLGVDSAFTNFGIRIKNIPTTCTYFEYDFTDCPDLAQTLAVTLIVKNIRFKLTGLDNLSIKETDRIKALVIEFEKLGIHLKTDFKTTITWDGNEKIRVPDRHFVKTYEDHRIALAFVPISFATQDIEIEDPDVVMKSYPKFWDDLKSVGFYIE